MKLINMVSAANECIFTNLNTYTHDDPLVMQICHLVSKRLPKSANFEDLRF